MRFKRMIAIAGLGSALMVSAPAAAQALTADHDAVMAELTKRGYKPELIKGDKADWLRIDSDGRRVTFFFFNCSKGKRGCTTMQLYAGFNNVKANLDQINAWNATQRWGRAYIDGEGDPVIEMDINMDFGGIDRELFWDNVVTFFQVIDAFGKQLTQ